MLRNREPIAAVLADWLPVSGTVLEIASGTGEHAIDFAGRFPTLNWQPSDVDPVAIASILAWRAQTALANLRAPIQLYAGGDWPDLRAGAILCINMAHISPWSATLGLLDSAARVLADEGRLIFYGPWLVEGVDTAPSNLEFDASLRSRNSEWGLRDVRDLAEAAGEREFQIVERRAMPANNFMLLVQRKTAGR